MNNSISFKIQDIPEFSDYEVRIFIDGDDLIKTNNGTQLGIFPGEFLNFQNLLPSSEPKSLLVARCDCGCVGCFDWSVKISREGYQVIWLCNEMEYRFDYSDYVLQIESAKNSKEWENVGMIAERLVTSLDFSDVEKKYGLKLLWASTRHSKGDIVIAFRYLETHAQILLSVNWDTVNPGSAVFNVFSEIKNHPSEWKVKLFSNNVVIPDYLKGSKWIF